MPCGALRLRLSLKERIYVAAPAGFRPRGGVAIASEPYDAETVVTIARSLWDRTGFADWRLKNLNRHNLRHRLSPVVIKGISTMLEERSPAVDEDGERYVSRFDAAEIEIEVLARGSKPQAQEAAQKVEDWNYQLHYDWERRRSSHLYAPGRRNLDQQVYYGCGERRARFSPQGHHQLFRPSLFN